MYEINRDAGNRLLGRAGPYGDDDRVWFAFSYYIHFSFRFIPFGSLGFVNVFDSSSEFIETLHAREPLPLPPHVHTHIHTHIHKTLPVYSRKLLRVSQEHRTRLPARALTMNTRGIWTRNRCANRSGRT